MDTDSIVLLTDRTGSSAIMTESMVSIAGRVFLLSEDLTAPDCVSTKEAMYFGTQKQIASGLEFISVLGKMIPHLQMRSEQNRLITVEATARITLTAEEEELLRE